MGDLIRTVRELALFADAAAGEGVTIDGAPDPANIMFDWHYEVDESDDAGAANLAAEIGRLTASVAELEAERDKLRESLLRFEREDTPCDGLCDCGDARWDSENCVCADGARARAALAGGEG